MNRSFSWKQEMIRKDKPPVHAIESKGSNDIDQCNKCYLITWSSDLSIQTIGFRRPLFTPHETLNYGASDYQTSADRMFKPSNFTLTWESLNLMNNFHKTMLDCSSQRGLHKLKHKYYFWSYKYGRKKRNNVLI